MNIFINCIGLIVFTYLLIKSCMLCIWALKSSNWPSVKGKILSADVEDIKWNDGYKAIIRYTFRINDKEYNSSRINFHWGGFGFKKDLTPLVNKYTKDKEIQVFYNPENPQDSCLEPGMHATNIGAFMLSALFTYGMFLMILK